MRHELQTPAPPQTLTMLCPPAAPTQLLEPVTLPGLVSCVLSVLCGGLNLLRGVHAIESVLQVPELCRTRRRGAAAFSLVLCFPTRPLLKEPLSPCRTMTKTLIT